MPDFFIVGAPKCGTTALYRYLREHPDVFFPSFKEPQYFCTDFPGIAQVNGFSGYRALFDGAPRSSLVGEASVWYLYSEVALENIIATNPNAKIIVMLRNPVNMAYSLHSQLVTGLREDIDDFEEAWYAQAERAQGRRLPPFCREPSHLQYRRVCSFPHQLRRLFALVPERQSKVIIYERFAADPRRCYREVLDFLSLPDDGRESFRVVNPNRVARSQTLLRWVRHPPAPLADLYEPARRICRRFGTRPIRVLSFINTRKVPRAPLRDSFRADLHNLFEPDIQEMEGLLHSSLDCWRPQPC
jgi:hypothetical protein